MIHNAEGAVGLAHEILRGLHRQLVHFWVFAGVSGSVEDQLTAKYFDCPSYGFNGAETTEHLTGILA